MSILPTAVMEELILRRTRAKTPVFRVGQLESQRPFDSKVLAERYQALLPARLMTPVVEEKLPVKPQRIRTIRKIKRQGSLRSLMKKHSRDGSISDSETLVGSTPTSPVSPTFRDLKKHDPFEQHVIYDEFETRTPTSMFDNDMALETCMELLTKELSAAVAREPMENPQPSELQVLHMIESFEKVQQHLRQKVYNSQAGDQDSVQDVERILEYWLKALYSVYDRAHELDSEGHEEDFPLPLSVSSNRPPARHPDRRSIVSSGSSDGFFREAAEASF